MLVLTRRAALSAAAFTLLTAPFATRAFADTDPVAVSDGPAPLTDGKAEGTLTVNGKTTKVAFAYARSVPGFFDKNVNDTLVIVSDVALDAKALADEFARSKLASAGKLHAFEIVIGAEGKPVSTSWRHNGFKGPTPSGLSTADVYTKSILDAKTVEGSYQSEAGKEFFGNTFGFNIRFRAAIGH